MRASARESAKKNFGFFFLCNLTENPQISLFFLYTHYTYRCAQS